MTGKEIVESVAHLAKKPVHKLTREDFVRWLGDGTFFLETKTPDSLTRELMVPEDDWAAASERFRDRYPSDTELRALAQRAWDRFFAEGEPNLGGGCCFIVGLMEWEYAKSVSN